MAVKNGTGGAKRAWKLATRNVDHDGAAASLGRSHLVVPLDDPRSIAPTILAKRARAGMVLSGSTPETDGNGSLWLASLSWTMGDAVGRTRWDQKAGTFESSPGENTPLAPSARLLREADVFRQLAGIPVKALRFFWELARISRHRACPVALGRRTVEVVAWRTAGSTVLMICAGHTAALSAKSIPTRQSIRRMSGSWGTRRRRESGAPADCLGSGIAIRPRSM